MNKLITYQSLIHLTKSESKNGFTLIELLIVVIIIGILSAVAIPNIIKQAAKAREAEAKTNLGSIARAQQTYHYENATFSPSISNLTNNASIQSKYFTFPAPTVVGNSIVKHQAIAIDPTTDQVRNYAVGVYFNNGLFDAEFCQSAGVDIAVNAPDVAIDPCTNGGEKIR